MVKWNEMKQKKKEKKFTEIPCVALFLHHNVHPECPNLRFQPPPPIPRIQRVVVLCINSPFWRSGFFTLWVSRCDVIDILDGRKFDQAYTPLRSVGLLTLAATQLVKRDSEGGWRGEQEDDGEEPAAVTRITLKKPRCLVCVCVCVYNWPPVNYTPRRASYKRKSIRHSACQPTGVDNN